MDSFLQRRQWSGPTEIGLVSELLWLDTALEQSSNRSRELSAAALPVSVSRHLVSTSVQFGQSAAEKTESDQSLLVAHLLCEQLRNLVALRHDHGQNAVARQIWNALLRPVWRMQIRHIAI